MPEDIKQENVQNVKELAFTYLKRTIIRQRELGFEMSWDAIAKVAVERWSLAQDINAIKQMDAKRLIDSDPKWFDYAASQYRDSTGEPLCAIEVREQRPELALEAIMPWLLTWIADAADSLETTKNGIENIKEHTSKVIRTEFMFDALDELAEGTAVFSETGTPLEQAYA